MENNEQQGLTESERQEAIGIIKDAQRGRKAVIYGDLPYSVYFAGFAGFVFADKVKTPLFNMDLLPDLVVDFSNSLLDNLQVSAGMIAPAIIAVGSLGIQKKYCVHPQADWYEPGNLYIAIIAEPSERKSPTM